MPVKASFWSWLEPFSVEMFKAFYIVPSALISGSVISILKPRSFRKGSRNSNNSNFNLWNLTQVEAIQENPRTRSVPFSSESEKRVVGVLVCALSLAARLAVCQKRGGGEGGGSFTGLEYAITDCIYNYWF